MPTDEEGRAGDDHEPRPQEADAVDKEKEEDEGEGDEGGEGGGGEDGEHRRKPEHHHKKSKSKSRKKKASHSDAKPSSTSTSSGTVQTTVSAGMQESGRKLPPPLPKPIVVSCAPAAPTAPRPTTPVTPRLPGAAARSPQHVALGTQLGADARICTYQNRTMTVSQFLKEAQKSTKNHVVGAGAPMYDRRALHQRLLHRARSTPTFKSWEMMCRQQPAPAASASVISTRSATLIHNAAPVPSSLPQSPASGACDIGSGDEGADIANYEDNCDDDDEDEDDMELGRLQRSAVSVLVRRPVHVPGAAGGGGGGRVQGSYSGSLPRRTLQQRGGKGEKLGGGGGGGGGSDGSGSEDEEEMYARLGKDVRFGSKHQRDDGSRNLLSVQRFGGSKGMTKEMAANALFRQMFQVFESVEQEREFVSTIVLTHTFIMPSAVFVEKLVSAYKNPALVRLSPGIYCGSSGGGSGGGGGGGGSLSSSSSSASITASSSTGTTTTQLTSVNDIRVRVLRCLLLWARLVDEFPADESAVSAVAAFMCDYTRSDLPKFTEECARRLLRLLMPMFLERESSLSSAPEAVLMLNFMLSPKYAPLEWTLTAEQLLPLQKRQVRRSLQHSNTVKRGLSNEAITCQFDRASEQGTERARLTLQDHSTALSSSSGTASEAAAGGNGATPGTGKRIKTLLRRASTAFMSTFTQKNGTTPTSSPHKHAPSEAPVLTRSNPSSSSSSSPSSSPQPEGATGTGTGAPVEVKANLMTSTPVYSAAERRRLMEAILNRVEGDESQFTARHLLQFWQMSEVSHRAAERGAFCSFVARAGVDAAVRECGVSEALVVRLADVLLEHGELRGAAPFAPSDAAVYCCAHVPPAVAEHVPCFPDVLPSTATAGALLFMGIAPRELARQLTLLEHKLFRAMRLSELTDVVWQDARLRDARAPNVVAFTDFSDTVSTWVATEVVLAGDLRLRAAVLTHMVELADECLRLQNYNGLLEIMLGLMHGSVARLRQTWAAVAPATAATFERLKKIAWPFPNYAGYRRELQQAVAPMIPALSVILIDLVLIDQCSKTQKTPTRSAAAAAAAASGASGGASGGNGSAAAPETPHDVVDLQRLRLHAAIFQSILNVKGCFYTLKYNHAVQQFLQSLTIVPASSLTDYSRACEPDQTAPDAPTNVQNGAHTLV